MEYFPQRGRIDDLLQVHSMDDDMLDFSQIVRNVVGALKHEHEELDFQIVQSKSVSSIAYDPTRCVLSVEYNNGILFEVRQISKDVFALLQDAGDFDEIFAQEVLENRPLRRVGRVFPIMS